MHGISFIQDLAVILVVAVVVGWLCQRIGLSVIVGFLVAGMVVGPFTPPFSLVTNVERIETLSQLGADAIEFWEEERVAAACGACGPGGATIDRVERVTSTTTLGWAFTVRIS